MSKVFLFECAKGGPEDVRQCGDLGKHRSKQTKAGSLPVEIARVTVSPLLCVPCPSLLSFLMNIG